MTNYIFIESRDPFESRDTEFVAQTAAALVERGHPVTVYLVQNAVLAARQKARNTYLAQLSKAGVRLQADDFSLSERGIGPAELLPAVQVLPIEALVRSLVQENTRALWH